jgi:hypothetical protein
MTSEFRDWNRDGRKVQLGPRQTDGRKLGLVWRNRKKISQIIKDYFYLPFFLLFILWVNFTIIGTVGTVYCCSLV